MLRQLKGLNWFRKSHPIIRQNRKYFEEFSQSRPLADYTFVVFDTELTGLNRRRDRIISIGAVKIVDLRIELDQVFHQYIRPPNLEHTDSTLIHRITPEQLRTMPAMEDVLPGFIQFCGDALLVGHYITLDMNFLNRAAREALGGTMSNPSIDTMRLAMGYKEALFMDRYGHNKMSTSYNLSDLSREFGLPEFKPHDALEDALQTAYLFLFLVKKMKKGKIRTLKDLYQAGRNVDMMY
ncbi:MAG: 3'-5' exonuclease [Desulfobulbaceae bacterium]|jgi:DNA polymerase-3 subunit epsilon|nr:3'-5' exonuclease [Desulfobulbaceae bacterium]MDY0350365.1 3'-5' exonuclease [Desulfobulbaceae bacterium]